MSLRDMIVDIGLNADSSPLIAMRQEMKQFTQTTNSAGSEVRKMGQVVELANRGMLKETQALNKEVNRQSDLIRTLARETGMSATQLADDWKDMSIEMRQSMIRNHNDMRKYRQELLSTENDMRKLSNQMGHYTGSTNDFMKEVNRLGKTHKKISDQMINNNASLRQGFIENIATLNAMSTQSEKISANYDRMGNAMYLVNKPLLAITDNLERMARRGTAANLAFQMLGPNASMKELQDMTRMITQGVMRQQAVVMAAGVAWLGFTAIMADAALGPDPAKIRAQQQELSQIYRDAWNKRVDEIKGFVNLFEEASIPKVDPSSLTKALQSQVNAIKTWQQNLQGLMKKGVDEGIIQELQKAGPAAAGEVKALNSMSVPQLNKYVSLWRQKMGLVRQQATTELAKLKEETDAKIKELQNSLTPLGLAWEKFKSTWADALKPFVDFWGQLAAGFVTIGTKVGEFVQYLNSISPWITKLAGMFLYLVTTFTLLLAPLAAGIGLFFGMRAAFTAAWAIIGPLVTGLGAMMGTVLLVSGVVLGLGVALYLLWTRSETFRNGIINGWNAIKAKAQEVWGFITPYINQAIAAVTGFVQQKMTQLQAFWSQNGAMILQAGRNVWNVLSTVVSTVMNAIWSVIKFIWPVVLALIVSVWNNIKGVINGALNIIMGAIKIFSGLFTGNFSAMWEGVKQTFFGALQFIWNLVNLILVGRMFAAVRGVMVGIRVVISAAWTGIRNLFAAAVTGIVNLVRGSFTQAQNIATLINNAISSVIRMIWSGIYNFLTVNVRGIINIFNSSWAAISKGTQIVWEFLKTYIGGALKFIWNNVSTIFRSMGAMIDAVWNGIRAVFWTVTGSIKTIVISAFNAIRTSMSDRMTAAWKTVQTLWGKIKALFNVNDMKTIGINVMNGLINGLGSMIGAAEDKIQKVAESLVKKFKDILGIQSPSRVFMGMGGHIIDGLVNGLTSGNLKDLGMRVFKDFGSGVLNTWEQIKGFLSSGGSFAEAGAGFGGAFRKSSGFGPRWGRMHQGVDYAAPIGTRIPAQAGGKVSYSGWMNGYGNIVIIKDANGIEHRYGHNSANIAKVGQSVSPGQIIGLVGNTGRSTGPHVHYETRKNGQAFNPGGFKGYATGTNGPLKKSEWAWVGEQGPELMRLNRGTEVFSHNDSMNMTSDSYNPIAGTSSSSGGSRTTITYNPTVNIYGSGSADGKSVKQQVQEALDEHYQKLIALFGTEVEI